MITPHGYHVSDGRSRRVDNSLRCNGATRAQAGACAIWVCRMRRTGITGVIPRVDGEQTTSAQTERLMADFAGYTNKRVVVSGCFSGIGEATARLLVQLGAEVHGLDYKQSKLDLASFRQV